MRRPVASRASGTPSSVVKRPPRTSLRTYQSSCAHEEGPHCPTILHTAAPAHSALALTSRLLDLPGARARQPRQHVWDEHERRTIRDTPVSDSFNIRYRPARAAFCELRDAISLGLRFRDFVSADCTTSFGRSYCFMEVVQGSENVNILWSLGKDAIE
jgi:hypothetical protein